jgi:FkbM family methyltransferase
MDLYGQEPETRLLGAFLARLDSRTVIDVGAERGAFAEEMLSAGAEAIHVIEPEPENAAFIKECYRDDARVTVHELAVSDTDGELDLHKSVDPSGAPVTFGHTVLARPDTDEIAWRKSVAVKARSLASLVAAGELPKQAGIVKIDTEGHDLAVVSGMGELECDVVMVEHWTDLPHSLGPCPWTTAEMVSALRDRDFSHFAFIVHRGEFVFLKWDDGSVPSGSMGNLVFLHDRVVERLLPDVVECASSLAERIVEVGEIYATAAGVRLTVIDELERERQMLLTERRDLLEKALRVDEQSGRGRMWARARSWAKPRIGNLRHYPPKPLRVPSRYPRTAPPDPAPTISIVTPSFQQGRFIERTVHSVVAQGYPALEYFVQDGGSTDETVDILHRLDGVLTGWASEPDRGQADAINRAFHRTSGEIMAWLNSDDLLLPGALAYVSRHFAAHPDVDVVYGHRLMIDEADGQIGAWVLPRHDDRALTFADYVPQETLFWRRSIWEAAGGCVDPSFGYALDWDLLLRFREANATMVRLPRFLGAFRIHAEQKTSAANELGLEEMTRLRERVHGRAVSIDEVLIRLRPYFLRHIGVHTLQRIADRLPLHRVYVRTVPVEKPPMPTALPRTRAGLDNSSDEDRNPTTTSKDTRKDIRFP